MQRQVSSLSVVLSGVNRVKAGSRAQSSPAPFESRLHCFEKDTAKTEKRDLNTAEQRWKQVQQRLREKQKDAKQKQRAKNTPSDPEKRTQ